VSIAARSRRALTPAELEQVARSFLADEDLWRPQVRHDPDLRHYVSLHEDELVGVWLICWMRGHDTGWHDHADSNGAFVVAEGAVIEERPRWNADPRSALVTPGGARTFDNTEIHRVRCTAEEPAVTIHAYSVPLTRMGAYRVGADGEVRRFDISWDARLEAEHAA
jgi:mannose-6-phosphate isomerase-like protein (cupin superfamily)